MDREGRETNSINRAEQGKNHGLISGLLRERTKEKFKFRIQATDHAMRNRQSTIIPPTPAHDPTQAAHKTRTHRIHERLAGWIQLRRHESSKERRARGQRSGNPTKGQAGPPENGFRIELGAEQGAIDSRFTVTSPQKKKAFYRRQTRIAKSSATCPE
jgi:hypothetical protein